MSAASRIIEGLNDAVALTVAAKAYYEASHDMRVELAWEECHPDYRAQKISALSVAINAYTVALRHG